MVLAHDITKGNRTQDVKIAQNITFETMLLTPNTMRGLKDAGFYKPSPIQLYGIPIGKCGFDLLLEAKSGTGKTAVFSIIALELLDLQKGLQVVILTPTREIAAQIYDVLKQIGSNYNDLQIEVVMGGLPFNEDIEKFKKAVHIVVGSPGRLKHLLQNKHIDTSAVRLLVLDEADKLMEKCFQADIKFIHATLPKQKQVIMSSATYSDIAKSFINNYVQNANHVCPDTDSILLGIKQKVTLVKYNSNIVRHTQDRFKELLQILTKIQFKQCLVFCNYQARVSEIHKLLKKEKWPSEQLYGQQEQVDRLDALKTLQQYKCRILVSTDLAARGIDASNIDLVVNFEPPYEWQTYLHRIGRAGRFGLYGLAVTILSEGKEQQSFKNMFKSMDLSIDMQYLWSDNKFNGNDLINSSEQCNFTTDLHEVNHELMWQILSGKTKDINAIESFKNLCESKEKFETPNIETFSELALSLQSQQCLNSDDDYLFKHMDIKNTSSVWLSSKEKCIDIPSAIVKNNKDNIVHKLQNTIVDGIEKIVHKEIASNSFDVHITGEELKEANSALHIRDKDSLKLISGENTKKITFENEPYSKDPLYSELPPMFSSSKMKSSTKKWKKSKPRSVNEIDVTYKDHVKPSRKDTISIQPQLKYVSHSCTKTKTSNSNRTTTVSDYNGINNSSKVHSAYKQPHSDFSYSSEIQNGYVQSSKKSVLETKIKQKMYADWYNRLKMKTKWMEQTIYINEMSKL